MTLEQQGAMVGKYLTQLIVIILGIKLGLGYFSTNKRTQLRSAVKKKQGAD